jgi:hypothetical protein
MPLMSVKSLSPGWCSGSTLPRTSCFGSLPIEQCSISFSENSMAGKVIERWQLAFRLLVPMAVGDYVDISLPGFEKYASAHDPAAGNFSNESTSSTTSGSKSTFAFEVMKKSMNPGFPPKLPEEPLVYKKLGCFNDIRTKRAVGGGTCGNFQDSNGVVTSVGSCARIAADKGFRGFCIADGSTCHTSSDFFLTYDTYNKSVELGDLETAAEEQFQRDMQREIKKCLNSSNFNTSTGNSSCIPTREFVFNTTGLKGCWKAGMGGPEAMACYQVLRKPKLPVKLASIISCGQCAQWDSNTQTLRFIAEEDVEAGLDLVLSFNSTGLALRAPIYGLAQDDRSVSITHSQDVRDVNARDKERSICKVQPIQNSVLLKASCVPPTFARIQQVLLFLRVVLI